MLRTVIMIAAAASLGITAVASTVDARNGGGHHPKLNLTTTLKHCRDVGCFKSRLPIRIPNLPPRRTPPGPHIPMPGPK